MSMKLGKLRTDRWAYLGIHCFEIAWSSRQLVVVTWGGAVTYLRIEIGIPRRHARSS